LVIVDEGAGNTTSYVAAALTLTLSLDVQGEGSEGQGEGSEMDPRRNQRIHRLGE